MKKIFLVLLLLVCSDYSNAQNWQWASTGQANDFDDVTPGGIVTDKSGNVYATGYFYNALTIDTFHLTSHGFKDVFWVKYDKSGNAVWAKSIGGKNDDYPGGIATDEAGNVYVFLSFSDTITDGGLQVMNTGWGNDLLLVKYDSLGNLQMYKTWSSIYRDLATSIYIDDKNQIYLLGIFSDYPGFPSPNAIINFDGNILTSFGGRDVFLVKLDSNLLIKWAKNAGSTQLDFSNKIAVDKGYNVLVCGQGAYYMYFDSIKVTSSNLLIFIAQYDSSGNALWAKTGTSNLIGDYWIHCTIGSNGSVYCAGTYDTPNNISPFSKITFDNTTLTGDYAFLVKYDAAGNLQWAKNLGKTARDAAYDIAVDSMDNLYVTGTFNYMGVFGADTFYTAGHDDIFVNKYDSNGNHIWTKTAGGITNDGGYAITLDQNNDIYIGGYISSSPAYFDNYQVSSAGYWDMCVAKLHQYPTGIHSVSPSESRIHIFPNPNNGSFTIDLQNKKYQSLIITDISGRQLYQRSINEATKQPIGLNLPDGMYFIRLTGKAQSVVQKIIVQH